MTNLTIAIVIVFCIGYFFIAIESVTKINKAAIALLMFVATWTLFMLAPGTYLPTAVELLTSYQCSRFRGVEMRIH